MAMSEERVRKLANELLVFSRKLMEGLTELDVGIKNSNPKRMEILNNLGPVAEVENTLQEIVNQIEEKYFKEEGLKYPKSLSVNSLKVIDEYYMDYSQENGLYVWIAKLISLSSELMNMENSHKIKLCLLSSIICIIKICHEFSMSFEELMAELYDSSKEDLVK